MTGKPAKLLELEAVRGIAAVIVLVHHTLLAFAPRVEGLFFPTELSGLFGTPAYALVNGSAAVAVFFVLSGFVLTYRVLLAGDSAGLGMAVLKRWPRLAGPVVVVSAVSGLLVWGGLYANAPAAELSRSSWLAGWFGPMPYRGLPPLAALQEGSVGSFIKGQTYFNGNLWTMYYELFGSFLAFGLALALIELKRPAVALSVCAFSFVLVLSWSPYFAMFVAGVGMAQVFALYRGRFPAVSPGWLVLAGLAALLLFGFRGTLEGGRPVGFYAFLRSIPRISPAELQTVLHTAAALLIMWIVMSAPASRRALGGPTASWLGRMSFPIYLTHLVVICSLGSHAFVWLAPRLPHGPAAGIAVAVTILATVVVSYPLARFDQWWVRVVNALAALLKQAPPEKRHDASGTMQPVPLELRSSSAA